MKKLLLFAFMFVLISFSVLAYTPFTVDVISADAVISKTESALFVMNITNLDNNDADYVINFPSSDWVSSTVPLSDYRFSIDGKDTRLLTASFTPKDYLLTGSQKISILVKNLQSGKILNINLPIQILEVGTGEYVPIVRYDVDMKYELDPREDITISLNLENLNYRDLEVITLDLESDIFSETRNISLGPKEIKEETFVFKLDDTQKPLPDVLKVSVFTTTPEKEYRWDKTVNYKIVSYNTLIKNPRKKSSFLKKTIFIDLKNDANIEEVYEIPYKVGWFEKFFTTVDPTTSYIIRSDEGRFVTWSITLKPLEETTLTVKTNYRILAFAILFIIAIIIMYYIFRSPIIVKKEVSHIGTSEGGISDIKVILFVKNRIGGIVEDISIIEKVPHIANVGKDFQIGTIRPSKVIQNPKKGTLVKWELQNLEGHEERIITYKIKSKLSILGGLTLPATIVKFTKKGRNMRTKSNRLVLEI